MIYNISKETAFKIIAEEAEKRRIWTENKKAEKEKLKKEEAQAKDANEKFDKLNLIKN